MIDNGVAANRVTDNLARLDYPAGRVDALLSASAATWPQRTAIIHPTRNVTFAQLDGEATRWAEAITELVGRTGVTIAVSNVLEPSFAAAFHGVTRSGNVVLIANPMYPEFVLQPLLRAAGARAAVVPRELRDRFAGAGIDHILCYEDLAELATAPVVPTSANGASVACVYFTSGTTASPKGVRLTHTNLVANALQTGRAHGLDEKRLSAPPVVLNWLPIYHPMHLNTGIAAGATQVLCPAADAASSFDAANRHRAHRYYTLPMRLAALAADPNLTSYRLDTVGAISCGGAPLPAAVARRLSEHFAIPVLQGYGLAETTAMTHLDLPERPRYGSVGQPAADTRCRVVHVDTREIMSSGAAGEIQVAGPQIMAGYLAQGGTQPAGAGAGAVVDADGWLSTGDLGYVDADGYLFVVDRLDDVFSCDHQMVAPSDIERVLAEHPAVRECVVVDRPDAVRGGVAHAIVVLADGMDPAVSAHAVSADAVSVEAVSAEVISFANSRLQPHQRVASIEVMRRLPRAGDGKVARRELRQRARDGGTVITLVNEFTVTGDTEEFERVLIEFNTYMSSQPGARGFKLLRSTRRPQAYLEFADWDDSAAHLLAIGSPEFGRLVRKLAPLLAKSTPPDSFVTVREGRVTA